MRTLIAVLLLAGYPLYGQTDDLTAYLKLVRDRKPGNSQGSVSEETITAANLVFSTISFLHKSQVEVTSLIGSPTVYSKDKEMLVYRYDNGDGGWEYRLSFRGGKVFRIEANGID